MSLEKIFIALIGLWAILVIIWAFVYFLSPREGFDVEDLLIEGILFILSVTSLYFIRNLKPLIFG